VERIVRVSASSRGIAGDHVEREENKAFLEGITSRQKGEEVQSER
jgi:hypothetical protein